MVVAVNLRIKWQHSSLKTQNKWKNSYSHPPDLLIPLGLVKPVLAGKVDDLASEAVMDFGVVQMPAGAQATVVMPDFHL